MAFFVFARSLVPRFRKMLIAASSAPTLRDKHALAGRRQVGERFSGLVVENQRADRHLQNHFIAGVPGAIRAFTVAAAVALEFAVVAIAQQGVVVGMGFDEDAAAVAAVSAGRPAARNEFLAPKRNAAVAAIAGLHQYFCFVYEHGRNSPERCRTGTIKNTKAVRPTPNRPDETLP